MQKQSALLAGAIIGGLAVAIGAFGAHALKQFLVDAGREDTFQLAVRYQFYHALALLATGLTMTQSSGKALRYSSLSFVLGVIIFSGSLYGLCFTGVRMLGAITPLGGVFFILGWALLAIGVYKNKAS
ncbi:MAG TPA: DUF423 domain-containing protein [Chryseolinea sp.]|jgi:uncharacterized membrane protein YgdD (TMEM256/DUF423 family)|nr:DUF423 domain-containing protein [Chryseolinea sp.]